MFFYLHNRFDRPATLTAVSTHPRHPNKMVGIIIHQFQRHHHFCWCLEVENLQEQSVTPYIWMVKTRVSMSFLKWGLGWVLMGFDGQTQWRLNKKSMNSSWLFANVPSTIPPRAVALPPRVAICHPGWPFANRTLAEASSPKDECSSMKSGSHWRGVVSIGIQHMLML